MPKKTPIDPLEGPKMAIGGNVVTMDDADTVVRDGVVYVDQGCVVAVLPRTAPPPPGFEAVGVVATDGTIFPGFIELHNHLSYNALQLWNVPKRYANRDQWSGIPEYRKLISGPMQIVGANPDLLPALIRYVECKCLFGGVTTSQGIQLFSNAGIRRYYRGIVRNVEQTDEPALPEAATRVADVEAKDARLFRARLLKQSCFLLHLSEGTDAGARNHFRALQMPGGDWAISHQLAGIHSAALTEEDFALLGGRGGSMVWSPMSNLLLYGATAKVQFAKAHGVRIGIGSDWSPSGSKNLLGELKVARLASEAAGGVFSDREIVAMATRSAASILQWDRALGSLVPGKRADLMVIASQSSDPYGALIRAKETDVNLVLINGVPRFGTKTLMQSLGAPGETFRVGGSVRRLFLKQETLDPAVAVVSLSDAVEQLRDAFRRMPQLARQLERPAPRRQARALLDAAQPPVWRLVLDELQPGDVDLRPRLPMRGGRHTGPTRALARASLPLSQVVAPMKLDAITVADDERFLERVTGEKNLPEGFGSELASLY